MLRRIIFTVSFLALFAAVPAFAQIDCKKGTFVGTYTRPTLNVDVLGNGSVYHSLVYVLTLNSNGTAIESWTGSPDYTITAGTSTQSIGSWTCRGDGNLVVNLLSASFVPLTYIDPYRNAQVDDITLYSHTRATYLLTITDTNTLTRTQARFRGYAPNEDPTNPSAGTLAPLSSVARTYTRLVASDADLLAP